MTQEEKDLLLKDLCARLPYGVKVQYNGSSIRLIQAIGIEGNEPYFKSKEVAGWLDVGSCKPYLRPMSSMTEEEREELKELTTADIVTGYGFAYKDLRGMCFGMMYIDCQELIDWLNKKMFDFRGLIPKEIALSTDEFNPYIDNLI